MWQKTRDSPVHVDIAVDPRLSVNHFYMVSIRLLVVFPITLP